MTYKGYTITVERLATLKKWMASYQAPGAEAEAVCDEDKDAAIDKAKLAIDEEDQRDRQSRQTRLSF